MPELTSRHGGSVTSSTVIRRSVNGQVVEETVTSSGGDGASVQVLPGTDQVLPGTVWVPPGTVHALTAASTTSFTKSGLWYSGNDHFKMITVQFIFKPSIFKTSSWAKL